MRVPPKGSQPSIQTEVRIRKWEYDDAKKKLDKVLRDAWEKGHTPTEIGAWMGVTETAIRNRAKRGGWQRDAGQ